MNCTRCGNTIVGKGYYRTKKGPHHEKCPGPQWFDGKVDMVDLLKRIKADKPTDAAMRLAEIIVVRLGRSRERITAIAQTIDQTANLPALERCRLALDALMETDHGLRFGTCGCSVCAEARAALAEAKKGGTHEAAEQHEDPR